jgi:RNA polymerase sigma-70 factor (ECF subfamily)
MARDVEDRLIRLLAEARDGRDDALEELLAKLHPALLRYAYAHVAREREASDLAADLTQDTLIRIVRGLDGCHAATNAQLIAWALSVLRNRIVDYFRHSAAHPRIPLDDDHPDGSQVHRRSTDEAEEPWERGRTVLRNIIRDSTANLSPAAVRLLDLRFGYGASWSQVATELGCERVAARRRFHRLRDSLRRTILQRVGTLGPEDRNAALMILHREPL